MEIHVYKSKKELNVIHNDEVIKVFPIGIGKVETGHKKEEGDHKTPEGDYRVCVKNTKSKFYLSLGLNYPNNKDATQALQEGRISEEEHQAICQKNDNHEIPLWNTILGGAIYIHGELEEKAWSEGCVRVFNHDMDWLFENIDIGCSIKIFP